MPEDEPTEMITVGAARVVGIDPEYPGLLNVEVSLHPVPDEDWQRIFAQSPSDLPAAPSMHPPRINGDRVTIRPPDDQLAEYVDALRDRVAATNADYDRITRSQPAELEANRQSGAAVRQRRIAEAQRTLDDLLL